MINLLHYPSGAAVTYAPDSAGRILSAIDSGNCINYVTSATYGPDSALTGFISGNSPTFAGITNAFSYNKRLQPVAKSAKAIARPQWPSQSAQGKDEKTTYARYSLAVLLTSVLLTTTSARKSPPSFRRAC